jgi:hypothetical protein
MCECVMCGVIYYILYRGYGPLGARTPCRRGSCAPRAEHEHEHEHHSRPQTTDHRPQPAASTPSRLAASRQGRGCGPPPPNAKAKAKAPLDAECSAQCWMLGAVDVRCMSGRLLRQLPKPKAKAQSPPRAPCRRFPEDPRTDPPPVGIPFASPFFSARSQCT